jgi:hypothetical protein
MKALVLALAFASQAGGPAFAGGSGIIVVTPREDRAAVTAAISGALQQAGAVRIVDALGVARDAAAAGAVPLPEMAAFRQVRERIDEGWRAYHNVQLGLAEQHLVAARTIAGGLLARPGMTSLYADASLRLGAVLAQLGRSTEAHDAIAVALVLDPDRPITQLEFSPEVIAAVDAVRAQPSATHAVRVTSEPPEAVVTIDGVPAGRTPITLELANGEHVVMVRAPGFQPRALATAGAELAVRLERDEAGAELARGVELGMTDRGAQALTDQVLALADLDDVLLVATAERRGGPTLFAQRCAGAPARCSAVVELGYADRAGLAAAARAIWQAVRVAELRVPPTVFGDDRLTRPVVEYRCTACRSPIVWAGVGVVALVATIVLVEVATSSRPPPILTFDPGRF